MSSSSSNPHSGYKRHRFGEISFEQERHLHNMLDEGLQDLKKSSQLVFMMNFRDTNKSERSNKSSSDMSFTLRNQMKKESESRSNSRDFKRKQIFEKYHQPTQQVNGGLKAGQSSLRMFLEELKNGQQPVNDDDDEESHRNRILQAHQMSPTINTSMASSGQVQMMKLQEESFSKIHNDIAFLQNKIKGLENKLQKPPSHRPIHQDKHSKMIQEFKSQQEDRIKKYQSQQQTQIPNQSFYSQNPPNKENFHTFNKSPSEDRNSLASDSESKKDYHSYPLRLKKQYLQQQNELDHQRMQLNQRYGLPQREVVQERFEKINDSPPQAKISDSKRRLQYENHVRSLTETDNQSSQSQVTMNDSTISVNDKLKQRIKQKVMKYQKSRRSQSRQLSQKSPSLKRSNTHDDIKGRNSGSKAKRQVRFSELKQSSRSRERRGSQASLKSDMSTNDVNQLKRMNAYLKQENEKLKRKVREQDDFCQQYKELKVKYRELHESHKRYSQRKKEQAKIIDEQKLVIQKLKKKVKLHKEKLKKLRSDISPVRSEHARGTTKMIKSYKSFVRAEDRQRSQRKVVPSDFRQKSKTKKHRF